ncbi:fluoride efflux transporter FluC [Lactiplantibacillus plantarum]|uniref:fluoride efflux transporter FluC n=1 Tax=Lactiplantibacillus plantarum TaxID=1590 RepID=UPI0009759F0C|nr:CrcB family protein [Lactiplantibacillus plantarum]
MQLLLIIGTGAAIGSVSRYDLTKFIGARTVPNFPLATLLINFIGAFCLGVIVRYLLHDATWYLFLGAGFCGGFTTFSTMANEIIEFILDKNVRVALFFFFLSVVGGITLFSGGYLL